MINNHILQAKIYISARRTSGLDSFNTCNGSIEVICLSFLFFVYDPCSFALVSLSKFISPLLSRFALFVFYSGVLAFVCGYFNMLRFHFVLNILFVAFVNVMSFVRSLVVDVYRVIVRDVFERCLGVYISLGSAGNYFNIFAGIVFADFSVYPQFFMNKTIRVGV